MDPARSMVCRANSCSAGAWQHCGGAGSEHVVLWIELNCSKNVIVHCVFLLRK